MANTLQFWVVDAFTPVPFGGNQAAVCLLAGGGVAADDSTKQLIAAEHNYSETAYVTLPPGFSGGAEAFKTGDTFSLRWFTPAAEVPLCGHATLAAAHVLFTELGNRSEALYFDTVHSGRLTVRQASPTKPPLGGGALIELDLPWSDADDPPPAPEAAVAALVEAATCGLGAVAAKFVKGMNYFLVELLPGTSRAQLEALNPDLGAMRAAVKDGVVGVGLTAAGGGADGFDYYLRFFGPWVGITEDPATGSAHCMMAPYWSRKLGKTELKARQCSHRGAEMHVRLDEVARRVFVSGQGVTTMRGEMLLPSGQ